MSKKDITETQTSKEQLNFDKDKAFLNKVKEEYLAPKAQETVSGSKQKESIYSLRDKITEEINKGNLSNALVKLEELKDLKSGVIRTINYDDSNKKGEQAATPVVIRDARSCQPVLLTESFEMQYLNVLKAGMEIAKFNENELLKEALKNMNNDFARKIEEKGLNKPIIVKEKNLKKEEEQIRKAERKRQKQLSDLVKIEKKNIVKIMNKCGIDRAAEKLEKVQNYQNFDYRQANIITITNVIDRTIIESEVGFRELTLAQKQDYQKILDNKDLPEWAKKMSKLEQELLSKKYAKIILECKHVIPTQLNNILGMRNGFEKTTEIIENEGPRTGKIKTLHVAKHAGTLMVDSKDEKISQEMTDENARQAQMYAGKKKLHCNTFNAGVIGMGLDPKIVAKTTKAMRNIGGKETNTSFNRFRLLGVSNDYTGVRDTLKNIAENNNELKAHIIPRSRFDCFLGLNKPKNNAEDILKSIDEPEKTIYRKAIELRKAVEKADVPFKLFGDRNNINLTISTELNILTNTINLSTNSKLDLPKEEILNMCKSGKDRTGLSMHDQSAQVIATELNIDIKIVDRELLKNGHTAQQAGSISAGGGTIGCYGTKSENKAGIPVSRIKNLISIIEKSASGNKINVEDQPLDKKELAEVIKANEIAKQSASSHAAYKKNQLAINQEKLVSNSIYIKSPTQSINRKSPTNFRNT